MAKRRNWSPAEIEVVIDAYLDLWHLERRGALPHGIKAKVRREALPKLDNRSAGSYEMKMMNVSAAFVAMGLPIVEGYKPYGNAQIALKAAVQARMAAREVA